MSSGLQLGRDFVGEDAAKTMTADNVGALRLRRQNLAQQARGDALQSGRFAQRCEVLCGKHDNEERLIVSHRLRQASVYIVHPEDAVASSIRLQCKHSGRQHRLILHESLRELCLLANGGAVKQFRNRDVLAELCGNALL